MPGATGSFRSGRRRATHYVLAAECDELWDEWQEDECEEEEPCWLSLASSLLEEDAAALPVVEDDESASVGSESAWSVVTGESSWTVEWELVGGPASSSAAASWGPSAVDDARVAAALQQEELDGLRQSRPGFMRCTLPVRRHRDHSPRLPTVVEEALRSRLGDCVVCGESVATVLMEPCGHLALCGACDASWARKTCVLCRCPGTPVHLLSPADDGMGSSSVGVCVRVADGAVSVPALEPAAPQERGNAKRERKRQMRAIARQPRPVKLGDSEYAGGVHGKRAQQAAEAEALEKYAERLATWKRTTRTAGALLRQPRNQQLELAQAHPELSQNWRWLGLLNWRGQQRYALKALANIARQRRPEVPGALLNPNIRCTSRPSTAQQRQRLRWAQGDLPPRRWYYQHYWEPSHKARIKNNKRAVREKALEETRKRREESEWRAQAKRDAAAAAAAATAVAIEVSQRPTQCVACGQSEACMMALPCRHVALCRPCWVERPPGEREQCAECGARCECLSMHRP